MTVFKSSSRGDRVQGHHPGRLGAAPKTDLRTIAIDLRQDWPTALVMPASTRIGPPHGSPRDSSISTAGSPGCLAGQHHRAQRQGQRLACEATPNRPQIDKNRRAN